jgi:hypothetical protein
MMSECCGACVTHPCPAEPIKKKVLNMTASSSKTFRDSLYEMYLPDTSFRVTLSNGVKLHGIVFAIYSDHLLMEDTRSNSKQLVRFEHIATVGDNPPA